MRIKVNCNDNLYCISCKEKIKISEKYLLIQEQIYNDSLVDKFYHIECYQEDDLEDPYICDE